MALQPSSHHHGGHLGRATAHGKRQRCVTQRLRGLAAGRPHHYTPHAVSTPGSLIK